MSLRGRDIGKVKCTGRGDSLDLKTYPGYFTPSGRGEWLCVM